MKDKAQRALAIKEGRDGRGTKECTNVLESSECLSSLGQAVKILSPSMVDKTEVLTSAEDSVLPLRV